MTQQLLSRSSYFFRTAAFLRSSFLWTVTFSLLLFQNSFFFRAKLLQSSHFLRIGIYLGSCFSKQLPFWRKNCLEKKDIYRRATFSKQVLLHIINFFRKAIFWKKLIIQKSNTLYYLLLLESCFLEQQPLFQRRYLLYHFTFQKTCFFTRYFFRRVNISQLRFLSTAILLTYLLVNKWSVVNVQFKFKSYFLCIYYSSKSHHWCLNKVSWLNKVLWNYYFFDEAALWVN